MSKPTNLRVVQVSNGHCAGGEYRKPRFALKFEFEGVPRSVHVECGGETRPTGQDLTNACRGLGLSADEIAAIPFGY